MSLINQKMKKILSREFILDFFLWLDITEFISNLKTKSLSRPK